jgi:DNA-binding YbaB/EbfC family protein
MAKGFGGLPGGGNMQALMQQAQKMQKEIQRAQAEVEAFEADGTAGGGAVKFKVNGKYEILAVEIAKEAVDPSDVEMLQDMIRAAANDAISKVRENAQSKMGKAAGGMKFSGLF